MCCVPTAICGRGACADDVWVGLEEFVFDWLLNADRCVPPSDYPSLLDLRGLLLDCTAQLAGALAQKRFASVTNRFFVELDSRASDTPSVRKEGGGGASAPSPSSTSSSGPLSPLNPGGSTRWLRARNCSTSSTECAS